MNYLILIGSIDVLPALFEDVYTTPEVTRELMHPAAPEPVARWASSPSSWLRVVAPSTHIVAHIGLGPGETSAIALAKELRTGNLLIDERHGSQFAREQGLHVFGTLAVLERAAAARLLDLPSALRQLQATSFRLSTALAREALDRDAARRQHRPPG